MSETSINMSNTERNLWNAIVGEAMALLKYNAFAAKAMEEGHPEIAQIFQEIAGAENIHGINHLKTVGGIKTSLENLEGVTKGEAREISATYPRMIKEALNEGRRDAAQSFAIAMDREKHHLQAFLKASDDLTNKLANQSLEIGSILTPVIEPHDGMSYKSVDSPKQADQQLAKAKTEFPEAIREIERERWRVAAFGRIREVVFGAQDGLLSTVVLVTALAAATTTQATVVVAGLAAAMAGMISMATGTYLGSKAEKEVFRAEIENEAKELEENPAEELAELVFLYHQQGMSFAEAENMAKHIASDKDLWLRTLVEKELGLDPNLVTSPFKDAIAMGGSFIIAALIPIIPYLLVDGTSAMIASIGAAITVLFTLGTAKGRLVKKAPLLQGLEILGIGVGATIIGYLMGVFIPRLF